MNCPGYSISTARAFASLTEGRALKQISERVQGAEHPLPVKARQLRAQIRRDRDGDSGEHSRNNSHAVTCGDEENNLP